MRRRSLKIKLQIGVRMLRILHWSGKSSNGPDCCEMEGSAGSRGDDEGGSAKKKRRPGLLSSFLNLFRKSDEDAGGFAAFRRSKGKSREHYPAVGKWLGKTASLHRFQVPGPRYRQQGPAAGGAADPSRKREYPETPPRPPPKISTSPPRRRRRRNRSGSQFSLFSISLEQKSRSMQSLLQGALGDSVRNFGISSINNNSSI